MPKYTVKNKESGKTITFNWNGKEPPTDKDMSEIFASAKDFKPSEMENVPTNSGGFIETMSPEMPEEAPLSLADTEAIVRPIMEFGGMTAGGVVGAGAGPVGGIAGAGLGYAAGKQGADLLYGKPQGTVGEELLESAVDASQGAAMEMGGAAVGKLVEILGPTGKTVYQVVKKGMRKAIRPSKTLTKTAAKTKEYYDKATDAAVQIILNKNNLKLTDESGKTIPGLPKTLDQFSEAIGQTKKVIFKEYDALTKATGGKLKLDSIADELLDIAHSIPLQDAAPKAARYAANKAKSLLKRNEPIVEYMEQHGVGKIPVSSTPGGYTAEQAQDVIQIMNQSLKAYYKNPSYETATTAYIDSLVANNLRKSLDRLITRATGKEYQQLKNSYGALKHIEEEVAGRAIVDARKNVKGLIDFADIFAGAEVIHGLLAMNPALVGKGVAAKSIAALYKNLNNPNRIVKNMFSEAENILFKEAAKIKSTKTSALVGKAFAYGVTQ